MNTQIVAGDAISTNARKQALKHFARQQLSADYQGCPFFVASPTTAEEGAAAATVSFALDADLNARIFALASPSALHRLSLFSACVKYLAYLHCHETEGCLAWAIATDVLAAPGTTQPGDAYLIPAGWRFGEAECAQPAKRLFGDELAQWKQLAALTAGISPQTAAGFVEQPPQVLVGYAESGVPFEAIDTAPYALAIWIQADAAQTQVHLRFDPGLAPAELAALLMGRLALLLGGMVFTPATPLAELAWLPAQEQARLAALSAPLPARPLRYANVAQAVAASLRERPDAVFLEHAGESVDFRALERYTAALLASPVFRLRESLGECVLIVGAKGIETTLAAIACLRVGVPFCLQSHSAPERQLADVVEVQATQTVLVQESCSELEDFFRDLGCHVVLLPDYADAPAPPAHPAAVAALAALLREGEAVTPDQALCVVMTSGSEGKPKGCINTHRALLNLSDEKQALYDAGPRRIASVSNHTFDYFVFECVQAMTQDVVIVLAPEQARADARECVAFLRRERIDLLFTTTVLAEDIMAQGDVPGLRQLYFGGESLRTFQKNDYALFNVYGPSETGVLTTCLPILRNAQKITIGRPFGGCQCVVVFPDTLQPCPIGVPGELLIGGAGVGLGYFNRADLTAKAFVQLDSASLQGRYYRSGDLCCWDTNGELEILGRRDRQLKINGFRVELDAVEKHALELPQVDKAAVVGVADKRGHARLVAFVVAANAQVTEAAVKESLSARLPAYMVPGQIVLVAELPLTRTGKLDRKALEKAIGQTPRADARTPSGPVQEWLAACWAESLELDPAALSADQSFFDLGGHSLRAARMLADVQQAFGQAFSLLDFFKNDTIEGLAGMIEARRTEAVEPAADDFSSLLERTPAAGARGPLSPQEARLYAEHQLQPDSLAYVIALELALPAGTSAAAVTQALQALIAGHDVLRTCYRLDRDGLPYAEILPALAAERVLVAAAQDWARLRDTPFDLEQGPLLRGHLLDAGTPQARLQLQIHHIVVDKPSVELLARRFAALLAGAAPAPAAPDYRRYALAVAQARGEACWHEAEAFWRHQLDGLSFDPFDHGAVAATGPAQTLSWQLAPAELAEVRRVCTAAGVTPATFFLALWGLAVAREGNSAAFSVSVANAARPRPAQQTVGMFVAMSPCAFRFERPAALDEYLKALADTQWRALDHLFYPVEDVFPLLRDDPRRFGSNPLLNVAYTYLDADSGDDAAALDEIADAPAHGPLNLSVAQGTQDGRFTLEYQAEAFSAAQIAALAAAYRDVLQQVLTQPAAALRVDTLIAPPANLDRIYRPARLRTDYAAVDTLLRDAFRTQGAQPAVIDDEGVLSWDGFAALTATYAAALNTPAIRRALIVGQGGRQLQAFLAACFLTRTTYLALEAGTPQQRIDEVLAHARPEFVLAADAQTAQQTGLPTLDALPAGASVSDWDAFCSLKSREDHPLAWILYSSGTTGLPKGICVSAHAAAQYIDSLVATLQLAPGLRVVQQFSPSFDGYLEEVLLAWALRGTSIVTDRYSLLDARKAAAFLARHRPDVLSAAPALYSAWNRMDALEHLPATCISGGDFLAVGDIDRLLPRTRLWNSYGPTETCIAVSMIDCARNAAGAQLSIGEPFDHVAFAVVDADGQRLAPGRWGELVIYSDLEHHGYLDDAALTAAKFGRDERGTFFRSGDLAMVDRDGLFHLKGRMDDSCKVRGNFIGLGELENRAGQYPGVAAAGAAVAFAGTPEACLVLAIEADAGTAAGLQQYLARHYARSHLPSAIFHADTLPRTGTGKLDRRGIEALYLAWREAAAPIADEDMPQGLRTLVGCWRNSLGFQGALARDADFFLVSGSSLSAVRLASQLEQAFGIAFSAADIFRNATLDAQWALVQARLAGHTAPGPLLQERLLNTDAAGLPQLLLLPPALGTLVELQTLADRLDGRITLSVLTTDPALAAELPEAAFRRALQDALQRRIAQQPPQRPLWLGGYSLGAEMLAALLAQQPELARAVDKLVFLDPNLRTEVFGGPALYADFIDYFRGVIHRAGDGEAVPADIDAAALQQAFPALHQEWCYYRLQHALLQERTFEQHVLALAPQSPPLALWFSDDADSGRVEQLRQRLGRDRVRRGRGDHFEFVRHLRAEDFATAAPLRATA